MTRVITFANEKGGVGKSTTTEAFASELLNHGYSVLLLDMDAQPGNLSLHVNARKDGPGIYELLSETKPTREFVQSLIQHTDSFGDIIAGDLRLNSVDAALNSRMGRELVLNKALEQIQGIYDFVLIDTPPALQIRTINAICAADDIIIPTLAEVSSIAGLSDLVDAVAQAKELTRREIRIAGLLVTRYDSRTRQGKKILEALELLADALDVPIFSSQIRGTVRVDEAQSHTMPLREYAPESTAAFDYEEIVQEYLWNSNYL